MAGQRISKSNPIFTEEWVNHNPWMKDVNESEQHRQEVAEKNKPVFNFLNMFHNFPDGVPIPALIKIVKKHEDVLKIESERLDIFNEMMGEKSIRAGQVGVGQPIRKNWGHNK